MQQEVFTPAVLRGVHSLIEGGSFAYRTKRANEQIGTCGSASTSSGENRQTGGFESGVRAHGPDAEKVVELYLALLRRWARDYRRRGAARIEYHPHTAGTGELTVWHTVKRHGTVSVTWP